MCTVAVLAIWMHFHVSTTGFLLWPVWFDDQALESNRVIHSLGSGHGPPTPLRRNASTSRNREYAEGSVMRKDMPFLLAIWDPPISSQDPVETLTHVWNYTFILSQSMLFFSWWPGDRFCFKNLAGHCMPTFLQFARTANVTMNRLRRWTVISVDVFFLSLREHEVWLWVMWDVISLSDINSNRNFESVFLFGSAILDQKSPCWHASRVV